jgi:hypothetical protein
MKSEINNSHLLYCHIILFIILVVFFVAEVLLIEQEVFVVRGSSDCKIVVSGCSEEVHFSDVYIKIMMPSS